MKFFILSFLALCTARPAILHDAHQPHRPHLCKICACSYDSSTWELPIPGDADSFKPFLPDSEALLVNCSGMPVSPFADGFSWPDVLPAHEEMAPTPKLPTVPATRANFSSCQLSGSVRHFPTTELRKLRELSLAYNSFSTVDEGALWGLHSLVLLDAGHNNLSGLPAKSLPDASDSASTSRLKDLRLNNNQFENIPWDAMLRMTKLERLDLGHNFIKSFEGYSGPTTDLVFKNLTVLFLNHNQLSDFPTAVAARFPRIRVLDLSWNNLETVSEVFTTQPPSGAGSAVGVLQHLKVLYLDGNQMKVLGPNSFVGIPFLHFLSVSETKTLSQVSAEAFDGLFLLRTLRLRENVHLSHLPNEGFLRQVRQMKKWTMEEIDLSYNGMEQISKDFLPWKEMKSIDLQGNPWNCNCSLQWMLDDLTPYLYSSNSSLLYDLRCAKPVRLRGRRFVRWMGHSDGVFCGKNIISPRPSHTEQMEAEVDEEEVLLSMNTGMLVAIVVLGVALLVVSVAAIVLQRRVKKRERQLKSQKSQSQKPLLVKRSFRI